MEILLKQQVWFLMQGVEDTDDVFILQYDHLFKDILKDHLASQSTVSM